MSQPYESLVLRFVPVSMGEHSSKKSLFLLNWGFVNPYLTHFVLERFLPKSMILKILSSKTKKFVQIPSSERKYMLTNHFYGKITLKKQVPDKFLSTPKSYLTQFDQKILKMPTPHHCIQKNIHP